MSATPVADRNALRALRQAGTPFVFWRDAEFRLRIVPLAPGKELRVGRAADNDVVFAQASVSNRHLVVFQDANGYWRVGDRRSTNGVYVLATDDDDDEREQALDASRFAAVERGGTKLLGDAHTLVRLGRRGPCLHVQLPDRGGDTLTETDPAVERVLDRLTPRRLEILIALARPKFENPHARTTSNRELGDEVGLSIDGVKTAVTDLRQLYGAPDRETLAAFAIAEGLAELAAARER